MRHRRYVTVGLLKRPARRVRYFCGDHHDVDFVFNDWVDIVLRAGAWTMHCFHGLIQASSMGCLYRYMGCASCTSAAGVRETLRRHKLRFPIVPLRDAVNSPQHPAPERYDLRMRLEDNMGDSSPQSPRCLKKHLSRSIEVGCVGCADAGAHRPSKRRAAAVTVVRRWLDQLLALSTCYAHVFASLCTYAMPSRGRGGTAERTSLLVARRVANTIGQPRLVVAAAAR